MFTYNIPAHLTLEDVRKRLQDQVQVPVRVCAAGYLSGTHFKLPDRSRYTSMGTLEYFLSTYSGCDLCVKRDGDKYYYDLKESDTLHLVYPLRASEQRNLDEDFSNLGLFGTLQTVYLTVNDRNVPEDLEPYVAEYLRHGRSRGLGIRFVVSGPIDRPMSRRWDWHDGFKARDFTAIQAPGWYSRDVVNHLNDNNNFCVCDKDPGPCVVCRGQKQERRHFGIVGAGASYYATNLVCAGCFDSATEQWRQLLLQVKP